MASTRDFRSMSKATLVRFISDLVDDLAALKASVDTLVTLTTELRTDHANFRTAALNDNWINPVFAIDTNFDVKNTEPGAYSIAGAFYTLADNTSCDTGTTAVLAAAKWGIMKISANTSAALTGTWATNAGAGYADEATAIAALPATPANQCALGYVTVKANASNTFTAGTDALKTGTGGNVAAETNYYPLRGLELPATVSSAAPTAMVTLVTTK